MKLENRIDFMIVISVKDANPNGDPLADGRPRLNPDLHGEISDVCIKRKIRNRMQDLGYAVFMQEQNRADDGCESLMDRTELLKKFSATAACRKWLDVRTFGQLLLEKYTRRNIGKSIGIRGPVTLQTAVSVSPVNIIQRQITRSVNRVTSVNLNPDTMGMRTTVEYGLYTAFGTINASIAEKTGFSRKDAETLKECILTMFHNDESSMRPAGGMELLNLIWWEHPSMSGVCSPARVLRSVSFRLKEGVRRPLSPDDYEMKIEDIPGLVPEVIEGR